MQHNGNKLSVITNFYNMINERYEVMLSDQTSSDSDLFKIYTSLSMNT